MEKDVYKTIHQPSEEVLFKDKGSKFFGYAFQVKTEEEVKLYILTLQTEMQGYCLISTRRGKKQHIQYI